MRKQIEHLAALAARPRVMIQVVPAAAGAYGGLSTAPSGSAVQAFGFYVGTVA